MSCVAWAVSLASWRAVVDSSPGWAFRRHLWTKPGQLRRASPSASPMSTLMRPPGLVLDGQAFDGAVCKLREHWCRYTWSHGAGGGNRPRQAAGAHLRASLVSQVEPPFTHPQCRKEVRFRPQFVAARLSPRVKGSYPRLPPGKKGRHWTASR